MVEGEFSAVGEGSGGVLATFARTHVRKHLEEPPALIAVALTWVDPFTLEVDVINEGVCAIGRCSD